MTSGRRQCLPHSLVHSLIHCSSILVTSVPQIRNTRQTLKHARVCQSRTWNETCTSHVSVIYAGDAVINHKHEQEPTGTRRQDNNIKDRLNLAASGGDACMQVSRLERMRSMRYLPKKITVGDSTLTKRIAHGETVFMNSEL